MQDMMGCVLKVAQHIGCLMLSPANGIAEGFTGRS